MAPPKRKRESIPTIPFSGDMLVSAIFLIWRFEINVVLQRFWEKVPKSQGGNMGRGLQAVSGIFHPWWGVCTASPKTKMSHEKTLVVFGIHPGRWTWNLQITHLERKMIFQTSMIMFHVNLQGCTRDYSTQLYEDFNKPSNKTPIHQSV